MCFMPPRLAPAKGERLKAIQRLVKSVRFV
jgi:hypothetical protein